MTAVAEDFVGDQVSPRDELNGYVFYVITIGSRSSSSA
jgi:hypothetical protein